MSKLQNFDLAATWVYSILGASLFAALLYVAWPGSDAAGTDDDEVPRYVLLIAAGVAVLGVLMFARPGRDVRTTNPRLHAALVNKLESLDLSVRRLDPAVAGGSQARLQEELEQVAQLLRWDLAKGTFVEGDQQEKRQWVPRSGYSWLFHALHAIELELTLSLDADELLALAIDYHNRISGSEIPDAQQDALLYQLHVAAAELGVDSPSRVFRPSTAEDAKIWSHTTLRTDGRARARHLVRDVQAAVIQFRDDRFDGIVKQRDLAAQSLLFTTLLIALAVALVILAQAQAVQVLSGLAIFGIAAFVGLMSRSEHETPDVEDYDLGRIIAMRTALFSGAAGIIGLLITVYGIATLTELDVLWPDGADVGVTPPPVGQLFNLAHYPLALLIGAAFGVAPRILLGNLDSVAATLRSEIKSVDPAS